MGELAKLEASLAAKGRLSDSWPLTHRAAVTAVLCWLLPAAEHCRWFRPVAKPGSFPLIRATQERLDTTVFVRSDTFSPPTAADLREHWAKPSVIKRGKAMGIGRLQHQSMRVWMAGLVTDAKAVQATIAAAAASPGAALLRSLMDRLGWFVELMDCHSIMEDDVIYKTIEGLGETASAASRCRAATVPSGPGPPSCGLARRPAAPEPTPAALTHPAHHRPAHHPSAPHAPPAAPGCTAMHTVEHIHEIPALVKLGEQMSAAVNAVTAASDGELTDDEKAELVTALETASAEAATRQEASAAEHHAMAAEAAARAESLKAAKDAAEGEAEAEGDAAATGSAPPSPSHVGVTEAEAGSRPAALAALWAACQAFVDSAPHVEAHFVGEETNLFPRLQSLSPQSHAEIFREVLSRVPRFAGGLLPFILGGLDPAQADQYLFTHRAHGKHTPEEWRSLVADVAAGVERGMLRPNKWRAILDRCTDVRKANEENEAAAAAADTEDDAVPAATPAESAVPAATPEE